MSKCRTEKEKSCLREHVSDFLSPPTTLNFDCEQMDSRGFAGESSHKAQKPQNCR